MQAGDWNFEKVNDLKYRAPELDFLLIQKYDS